MGRSLSRGWWFGLLVPAAVAAAQDRRLTPDERERAATHVLTGRVERVDTAFLQTLLEHDVVPVIPPVGCDGAGNSYRLNSDAVAVEVAS